MHQELSERWLGSFPILKKFSNHAYHLKLPPQWKYIHPVFHISLLEPFKTSMIPNWHQAPPPSIIIEEEEEWEVSQILDSKIQERKVMVFGGMERFQSKPRKIHVGTSQKPQQLSITCQGFSFFIAQQARNQCFKSLTFRGSWWGEELPKVSPTSGVHL
ncbi:hypothetical protein O181_017265 [Austropuccinia psidii MF-1]|uniref:Tf2-1-like SH3-like domain-containing protein n=1 Tax=Austropuccinia psidii MF-1 TaxID=1389203 RepID=A0A9Q3GSU6_9BASI|nr:hypothetical protein [Austropuccinia psidii MF-1]